MALWSNNDGSASAPKFEVAAGHNQWNSALVITGAGTITANSATANVNGSGTTFTALQPKALLYSNSSVLLGRVKSITNSTQVVLYAPAAANVAANGFYYAQDAILTGSVAYQNTTPNAFVNGLTEGVYGVSRSEVSIRESQNMFVGSFTWTANATSISFSNGDVVTGANSNTYSVNATGTITTNTTGGITSIAIAAGAGGRFVNTSTVAVTVANSTGGVTTGNTASANIQPVVAFQTGGGINHGVSPGWVLLKYGEGGITTLTVNAASGVSSTFANNEQILFSNGSVNAVANVTTNATGHPVSAAISGSAGLFANVGVIVQAPLRQKHLFNYVITVNANAIGFSNGDLINGGNGLVNSVSNITTNVTGGITSTTTINPGLWGNAVTNAQVTVTVTNATGGATTGNTTPVVLAANLTTSTNTGLVVTAETLGGRSGRVLSEVLVYSRSISGNTSTPPFANT